MKKNLHKYDRALRISTGAALSSMAFWGPKNPWLLAFLVPVATGLVGTCPFYSAFNISTRKKERDLANDYFPVQSSSEMAAGHPIVGAS